MGNDIHGVQSLGTLGEFTDGACKRKRGDVLGEIVGEADERIKEI